MQIPLEINGLISLVGFAAAVVYQSGVLKKNLEQIAMRTAKVEEEMEKITGLLIHMASAQQQLNDLNHRVGRLEDLARKI